MLTKALTPFLMVLLCGGVAAAQPAATVTLDPTPTMGLPGQTITFIVHVSTQDEITGMQFTLEFDSTIATFQSAVDHPTMPSGYYVTNVNENLPSGPTSQGTNENVLVQISSDDYNDCFSGEQDVAIVSFLLNNCGTTPMNFERQCQRTHLSTKQLIPICEPTLMDGQVMAECTTDVPPVPGNKHVRLLPNVPNPFNPSTNIRFELQNASPVKLRVFDANGRIVRVLLDAHFSSGPHEIEWDGSDQLGKTLPSGVYYYQLSTPSSAVTRRTLMIK